MNGEKQVIFTDKAPVETVYSQAIKYNNLLFLSGQIPVDPETKKVIDGTFEEQIRQTFSNIQAILEAGNSSLDKVLKVTVFLTDMDDFKIMNEIYAEYFKENKPARTCVQAKLPFNMKIEIDVIAYKNE